uniref:hypothetical protein n=1 Tax=Prevotella sp. TaxID=59823 RepID=UPI00307BCD00
VFVVFCLVFLWYFVWCFCDISFGVFVVFHFFCDKEKALTWLGALRTHRGTWLTEQELSSATICLRLSLREQALYIQP